MKKILSRSHGLTLSRSLLATSLFTCLTLAALTFAAAIKEGYVTRSATITTNTAEVFFPQNPVKIMRLVSYDVNGDTNTAILTMYSGTMPLTISGIINVTNLVVTANTNVVTNQ